LIGNQTWERLNLIDSKALWAAVLSVEKVTKGFVGCKVKVGPASIAKLRQLEREKAPRLTRQSGACYSRSLENR
jgi:hypothetical protein